MTGFANMGFVYLSKFYFQNSKWDYRPRLLLNSAVQITSGERMFSVIGQSERPFYLTFGDNILVII